MPELPSQLPDDDDSAGIASALIKARNEQGLTQAQLSEVSGISRSAIKGYEVGRNMPGSRELKALCQVLKVSPTALLYGSDQAFTDRLGNTDVSPESQGRWQLFAICKLLPPEEVNSLLRLARSIAIARHGVEAVNNSLSAGAQVAASLTGEARKQTQDDLSAFVEALDSEGLASDSSSPGQKPRQAKAKKGY